MSYTSSSWLSRSGSMLLSAGFHLAIGFAIFAGMKTAAPPPAHQTGERGRILVVELQPFDESGAPDAGEENAHRAEEAMRRIDQPGEAIRSNSAEKSMKIGAPPTTDGGLNDQNEADGLADDKSGAPVPAGAEVQAYRALLLRHIQQHQQYPLPSRQAGEQGVAQVRFVMDRSGRLGEAWVETTSGSGPLDAEALAALRRAQPLPPPPDSWPQSFEVVLPILFRLN
ncbi:TonB family protein [Altererythrobacter xixiisoli]|uniref:TonB family protein n=1 Tax=Croceibacterium xixiisoli TaxID=1476466 RepID=A0A6I4TP50_9SPHN|nr:TonB family protein [Croceibacterium xixiisoli]MXO97566.1 TonB family protein [Croceibacterium xixiisoli]